MIEQVNVDIYLNSVIMLVGIDEKEFDDFYYRNVIRITDEEYREMRKDIADENSCDGFTMLLDNGNVIMFVRKGCERKDLTVIHELYHSASKLLSRAGIEQTNNEEPFAYLIAWLANEYFNRLDDFEKGKK